MVCFLALRVPFVKGQKWPNSVLNRLVNQQNTQFNSETINQASNCHTYRGVVFRVSSFVQLNP